MTDPILGKIAHTIYIGEASLLRLTVEHPDQHPMAGAMETVDTTIEHPFWVEGQGWTRADELVPGDRLTTLRGTAVLRSAEFLPDRVLIYNLSLPASPTYFVGDSDVWVHNTFCKPAWNKITVNWSHIRSRHTVGGDVYQQSGIKSAFPDTWSWAKIQRAVRESYKNANKAGSGQQSPTDLQWRQMFEGTYEGKRTQMYFNWNTNRIESAWPVIP